MVADACCTPAAPCRRCELWERYAAGAPITELRPCVLCADWWPPAVLDERTRLCPACEDVGADKRGGDSE